MVASRIINAALFLALAAPAATALACPDIDGLVDINCDRRLKVVAFGNSITYGTGDSSPRRGYPGRLKDHFPSVRVRNLGVPGERTAQGKSRLAREMNKITDADYVIILEGVNDYWAKTSSASTKSNLLKMVSTAKKSGTVRNPVVLLGRLLSTARSYQLPWVKSVNSAIARHTQINFYALGTRGVLNPDKLHPSASGYKKMAKLVHDELIEASEDNRPVDVDGDGIYDFAEIHRYSSSRTDPDSDDDGLLDGEEVFTYGSSPNLVDTDGDGYTDFEEATELHSDPADPRPSPPQIDSLVAVP